MNQDDFVCIYMIIMIIQSEDGYFLTETSSKKSSGRENEFYMRCLDIASQTAEYFDSE